MNLHLQNVKQQVTVIGGLSLCKGSRQVKVENKAVNLTSVEFNLLSLLMKHSPELLPRSTIIGQLFHGDENKQHVLNIHISNLRKKLRNCSNSIGIQAMRGQGYYLIAGR